MNDKYNMVKKFLVGLSFIIFSSCLHVVTSDMIAMDKYCFDSCYRLYDEALDDAKWLGNNFFLRFTKCACYALDREYYYNFPIYYN